MAIGEIKNPYEFFTNADGTPLEAGQIYIGVDGLDPQDNPQAAYFDLAGTIGATQPIRTSGGYPVNAGSATKIFTDGSFSVKVLDENNNLVYSDLSVSPIEDSVDDVTARVDAMAVPFDTVADFFTATLADIKTAANATTGTAYVETNDGLGRYLVDLDQADTDVNLTTTAGINAKALPESDGFNVLAFNTPADDTTDATASAQLAYNAAAGIDGARVIWPRNDYYVAGTIYFATNTQTDLCGSNIRGDNQDWLFETGYVVGGVVVSNLATSDTSFEDTTALYNSGVHNGKIHDVNKVFRLYKFLAKSSLSNIEFYDCGQFGEIDICFYSQYKDLTAFYSTFPDMGQSAQNLADATIGSNTITIPNARLVQAITGRTFCSFFTPDGTTITSVGAEDSAGAGFATVTLSQNAIRDVTIAGIKYAGWSTYGGQSLLPRWHLKRQNQQVSFYNVHGTTAHTGFKIEGGRSISFYACDVTRTAKAFDLEGVTTGITVSGLYTEYNPYWIFYCAGVTSNLDLMADIASPFQVAGLITAGSDGKVTGVLRTRQASPGFSPFGSDLYPEIDLSSPNASMIIEGMGGYSTDYFDNKQDELGDTVALASDGLRFDNSKGTSSPNVLDYYEEGTFTPTVTSAAGTFGSMVLSSDSYGRYTRIGNRVIIDMRVKIASWSTGSASGNILIGGFPFTASGSSVQQVASAVGLGGAGASWGTNAPDAATILPLTTYATLAYKDGSYQTNITVADLSAVANRNNVNLSFNYVTE